MLTRDHVHKQSQQDIHKNVSLCFWSFINIVEYVSSFRMSVFVCLFFKCGAFHIMKICIHTENIKLDGKKMMSIWVKKYMYI